MWLPGSPISLLGQHIALGQCAKAFTAALRKLPGLTHLTRHSQRARLGRKEPSYQLAGWVFTSAICKGI